MQGAPVKPPEAKDLRRVAEGIWDVAVIGAGPAGSLAARQLSRRGHRIALIERKPLPRNKVCGACLNRRARSALYAAGLQHIADDPLWRPVSHLQLHAKTAPLRLPLLDMSAVCRSRFDMRLADEASKAGATLLAGVEARVETARSPSAPRCIDLILHGKLAATLRARSVVVADGLGHPSLRTCRWPSDRVARSSRVGIGASFKNSDSFYAVGTVYLGIGRHGYMGAVRVADDQLNLAAAVDPAWLREVGNPCDAAVAIANEARLPLPDGLMEATWRGTVPLTRRATCVAQHNIFLTGDAAGYVEPFTGEGMAAALVSSLAVVPFVERSLLGDGQAAAREWADATTREASTGNRWCHRLAWLARRPAAARWSARMVSLLPGLSRPILRHIERPVLEPTILATESRQP